MRPLHTQAHIAKQPIKSLHFANAHSTAQHSMDEVEVVRGHAFLCGPRYTGLQFIGEGAYGQVWCVVLHACVCVRLSIQE